MEREYKPDGEQFAEGSGRAWEPERTVTFLTSLVQQPAHNEEELHVPDAVGLYTLLTDLRIEAYQEIPEPLYETIRHVTRGFGFLVYDHLPEAKKAVFLWTIRGERNESGSERLELTLQEGQILQRLADAVGIEYDAGEQGNPEQRTFTLAEIENKPPDVSKLSVVMRRLLNPSP